MSTVSIKRAIDQFCSAVDGATQDLNSGGCGAFAYILGHQLDQLADKGMIAGYRIRVGMFPHSSDVCPFELNIEDIANSVRVREPITSWWDNGVTFDHIVTEVGLKENQRSLIVDSENIVRSPDRWCEGTCSRIVESTVNTVLTQGSMPLPHLHSIVRKRRGWNSVFDRRQLSTVAKLSKTYLSKPFDLNPVSVAWWEWVTDF